MSDLSDFIGSGIGLIASLEGSTSVERWDGSAWQTITGAIWHERTGPPEFDDNGDREGYTRSATLTFPATGTALANHERVRVAGEKWRVVGPRTTVGQLSYFCERWETNRYAPDRGHT